MTQAVVGHREARRALDDTAREERRWQPQREARTHEARAAAYAQLMGAIEAFDAVLFQARRVREAGIKTRPAWTPDSEVTASRGSTCGSIWGSTPRRSITTICLALITIEVAEGSKPDIRSTSGSESCPGASDVR